MESLEAYRVETTMSSRAPAGAPSSGAADHARDAGDQLGRIDRLGEVDVEASLQAANPIFRPAERRERDRGNLTALLGAERPQLPDQRIAVLSGHLDVGHEHVGSSPRHLAQGF